MPAWYIADIQHMLSEWIFNIDCYETVPGEWEIELIPGKEYEIVGRFASDHLYILIRPEAPIPGSSIPSLQGSMQSEHTRKA